MLDDIELLEGYDEVIDRASLLWRGSDSSRTVGEIACAMVLRLADIPEDIRRIIRLALFDFFSAFSSPVDDVEPAVGGGERDCEGSRLEVDTRLLIDIGR